MALIECDHCGHLISDKAERCPKCGSKKGEVTPKDEKSKIETSPVPHEIIVEKETEIEIKKEEKNNETEQTSPVIIENERLSKNYKKCIIPILLAAIIGGLLYYLSANKEEEVVITPEFSMAMSKYEEIYSFKEGLAAVKRNGRWGYINTKGKEVIPCQYLGSAPHEQGFSFSEGLAVVRNELGKYGYIDKNGNMVIEPVYTDASYFSCGVAAVCHPSKNGIVFIDKYGNVIEELSEKYYKNRYNLPIFYNDTCEVAILKPKEEWREGDNTKTIWIDIHGNRVNEPNIKQPYSFDELIQDKERWVKYEDNGNYGYKDKDGNIMIRAKYKSIAKYSNGVALVTIGHGKWAYKHLQNEENFDICGFVDRNGKDTFTPADYKKIENAKWREENRKINEELRNAEKEKKSIGPNWLQGVWMYKGENVGNKSERIPTPTKLHIVGNRIKAEHNERVIYEGDYEYLDYEIPWLSFDKYLLDIDSINKRFLINDGKDYYTKQYDEGVEILNNVHNFKEEYNVTKEIRENPQFKTWNDVVSFLKNKNKFYSNLNSYTVSIIEIDNQIVFMDGVKVGEIGFHKYKQKEDLSSDIVSNDYSVRVYFRQLNGETYKILLNSNSSDVYIMFEPIETVDIRARFDLRFKDERGYIWYEPILEKEGLNVAMHTDASSMDEAKNNSIRYYLKK